MCASSTLKPVLPARAVMLCYVTWEAPLVQRPTGHRFLKSLKTLFIQCINYKRWDILFTINKNLHNYFSLSSFRETIPKQVTPIDNIIKIFSFGISFLRIRSVSDAIPMAIPTAFKMSRIKFFIFSFSTT